MPVMTGIDIRHPSIGGNEWWHLTVLETDNNKITVDMHLMDTATEFGEAVTRQR